MKILLGTGVRDERLTRPNLCLIPVEESFTAGSLPGHELAAPTPALCNCVRMDALNFYLHHRKFIIGPCVRVFGPLDSSRVSWVNRMKSTFLTGSWQRQHTSQSSHNKGGQLDRIKSVMELTVLHEHQVLV